MNKTIGMLLFLLVGTLSALSQQPLSGYAARTIADITELNKSAIEVAAKRAKIDEESELPGTDLLFSKVQLAFLGAVRPIGEGRKKLIVNWARSQKLDKKASDSYVNELKFGEGTLEYWLGIPNELIPSIAGKIKKGETVSLYVSYTGAIKPRAQRDFESVLVITAVP